MFKTETRLIGLVLGFAGVVGFGLAIAAGVQGVLSMRTNARAYTDCLAIAGVRPGLPSNPPRCSADLAEVIVTGVQSRVCDEGLAKPAGAFVVRQSCSAEVKRLVADRDARATEAANRNQLVDQLKTERAADVGRAEARALVQAKREANATKVLTAAPRDDRGRIACDADCLSVLAGDLP